MEPEQPELETAYVMGGHANGGGMLSSMERYDSSSNQWVAVAAMRAARRLFGICAIVGELYVTGGKSEGQNVASVEKYSPSSDTWGTVAPMPAARVGHAAVAVGSFMYVLGGVLDHSETSTVLKFDSIHGTWSEVAPLPASRYDISACVLGNDIYVFGGEDANEGAQDSVFKYDMMANTWSTLEPMPFIGCGLSLSVIDGMICIMGDGGRAVHRFNPESGAWNMLTPMSRSRLFSASFVLNGNLYAASGVGAGSGCSVERYDIATDTWTVVADMLQGRAFFGAATIQPAGPGEEQDLFDALITQATRHRAL
jgi:N-acetylneuraminic acid mutarotase